MDFRSIVESIKELFFNITEKLRGLWDPLLFMVPESFRMRVAALATNRIAVTLIILLIIGGGGWGIKKTFFTKKKAGTEATELVQVKVRKAKRQNYTDTYTVMGTIKGAIENELRFEIDGVLARYHYREGDRVPKGKSICSLDPKDAYTKADFARSKYTSEQSTYFSAVQRLKVYEDLFKMKAISESKIQEARFETQSAEARMKAALSELELSQSNLSKTNLAAPSEGLLAEILIKPGDYVTPQDVVAKFISGTDTNFEVDVPEKDVSKLKAGLKVKINCDSFPGRDFFGTLNEIAPTVKERTRTTTVKIGIDNPGGALRSGMFGRGVVILTELSDVILVPSDSVVSLGDTTFLVPLVKPDTNVPGEGIIEMRPVKPGTKLTKMTVIDSGINPDDMVVIETQGQLSDGMRIKFIESIVDKLEEQQ